MNQLVVLFAVVAVACGSVVPAVLVQPPHHPALVLDPHGRPLDTAEVVAARAVHLQAKALEGHHYAPLVAAPLWHGHSAIAAPWFGAHGHLLKKRSLAHLTYAAPVVHHAIAPSAVSHQSRVDVVSSPAVVSHAVAPVVAHAAPVVAHAAPAVVAVAAPSAVSHQSRVDVHSAHSVVAAPAYAAHSVVAAPAYSAHSVVAAPAWGHSLWGAHAAHSAHGIWKRSLGHFAHVYAAPAAVSHQSRVDVVSSPAVVAHAAPLAVAHAAPLAVAHAAPIAVAHAAPAAVSHVSRVDIRSSPAVVAHAAVAPIAHSVHSPWAHYSHHGLHSSPLVHAW